MINQLPPRKKINSSFSLQCKELRAQGFQMEHEELKDVPFIVFQIKRELDYEVKSISKKRCNSKSLAFCIRLFRTPVERFSELI